MLIQHDFFLRIKCLIIIFLIIFILKKTCQFCLSLLLSWFQKIKSFFKEKTKISCRKKHGRKCRLFLCRPYPFQLWVAPRNRLSRFFYSAEEKNSPPGFEKDYALFLYPDSIAIHWIIFFIGIVAVPQIFAVIFFPIRINWVVLRDIILFLGGSLLFFLFFYKIIYVVLRRPILDDLWNISPESSSIIWPKTEAQTAYFQSVPSRITFCSKNDLSNYRDRFPFFDHSENIFHRILLLLFSCFETIFFWEKIQLHKRCYFHRPIFFNPKRSLQEAMLCTGIASFFSAKENNSLGNILLFMFYSLSHIWVSYLYLVILLLWIFIQGKPFCNQSETIYLVVQIVFWLILSAFELTRQFSFIQGTLLKSNRRRFSLVPPRLLSTIERKLQINNKTINFSSLNPKRSIPLLSTAVFVIYLALLNLVLQYDKPADSPQEATCKTEKATPSKTSELHIKFTLDSVQR
ncbi:MAG: hypothetical protein D3914_01920 [Candidatus Electrothrix sp. LOE2]|nr:hypothetical protein [Candidatus Electrothrix sp. LOE2]